jgi:hypothetical protein
VAAVVVRHRERRRRGLRGWRFWWLDGWRRRVSPTACTTLTPLITPAGLCAWVRLRANLATTSDASPSLADWALGYDGI